MSYPAPTDNLYKKTQDGMTQVVKNSKIPQNSSLRGKEGAISFIKPCKPLNEIAPSALLPLNNGILNEIPGQVGDDREF